MKKDIYVSVSTDPIKEYQGICEYAKQMQGVAEFLHCDIMDGVFVKNKTYDYMLVSNINQNSLIMLDVHLMCSEPLKIIKQYIKAGANLISIHYEAFKDKADLMEALNLIKSNHILAGLAFNPSTPLNQIKIYAHDFDVFLVMSVVPGESGQKFIPECLEKIKELSLLRKNNNYTYKIEVDGGVNEENVKSIIDAGADIIVSGSYIFNHENKEKAVAILKGNI